MGIVWLKASYHFHTYCYRDPRSVFASGVGVPVVSPTTVYLGMASTLFRLGQNEEAHILLSNIENFQIAVDSPDGIIFFRAFHQVRRYHSGKWGPNPRIGLTLINQATKEYGLIQGEMSIYLGIDKQFESWVGHALENLTHLGTKDSLCSLVGQIERVGEPIHVVYKPSVEVSASEISQLLKSGSSINMVTLSRFIATPTPIVNSGWCMSGGRDTENITYVIPGKFSGTTSGKIYTKH